MKINIINEFGEDIDEMFGISKERQKILKDIGCKYIDEALIQFKNNPDDLKPEQMLVLIVEESNSTEEVLYVGLNAYRWFDGCIKCKILKSLSNGLQ